MNRKITLEPIAFLRNNRQNILDGYLFVEFENKEIKGFTHVYPSHLIPIKETPNKMPDEKPNSPPPEKEDFDEESDEPTREKSLELVIDILSKDINWKQMCMTLAENNPQAFTDLFLSNTHLHLVKK
ncbi:MAG: hypothetical protein IIB83_06120 [Bacteroidetes bacterium]|nr:hypothetical protein [Bacteroidota bacterium]